MGGTVTIRIVIADDHPIVQAGLELIFAEERDFQVMAQASDGDQALQAVLQFQPDILVLDLRMPGKNGIGVLREIERQGLQVKVVVLTAAQSDDVLLAIRLGARGVVLKDIAMRLLVDCIRVVNGGGTWFEKSVATRAVDRVLEREKGASSVAERLTAREVQVAGMVAAGLPSKRVAQHLAISEGTVKLHLHNIYSKLNLRGRVGLARYMQRHGFD